MGFFFFFFQSPRDFSARSSLGPTGLRSKGDTSDIHMNGLQAGEPFLSATWRVSSWEEAGTAP